MFNEFVFYALLAGAIVFGSICLFFKDSSIAWLGTVLIGFAVILFVFPGPVAAKTVGDVANNLTLAIQKFIYAVGWLAGAFVASLIYKKLDN